MNSRLIVAYERIRDNLTNDKDIKRYNSLIKRLDNCGYKFRGVCRIKFCPNCEHVSYTKKVSEISKSFDKLKNDNYKAFILKLKTEKVKPDDLKDQIVRVSESFRRLISRSQFIKSIKGFFRTLIIDYDYDNNLFTVGLKVFMIVKQYYFYNKLYYIDHNKWVQLWKESLRADYTPDCEIITLSNTKYITHLNEMIKNYNISAEDLNSKNKDKNELQTETYNLLKLINNDKGIYTNIVNLLKTSEDIDRIEYALKKANEALDYRRFFGASELLNEIEKTNDDDILISPELLYFTLI